MNITIHNVAYEVINILTIWDVLQTFGCIIAQSAFRVVMSVNGSAVILTRAYIETSYIMIDISQRIKTSWHSKPFRIIDPLWGESDGHRWFPTQRASNAENWCLLLLLSWKVHWLNNKVVGDVGCHATLMYWGSVYEIKFLCNRKFRPVVYYET